MGVGGQHNAPAALPPGKTRYPLYRRLSGPQDRSGRVCKISSPLGFDPQTGHSISSRLPINYAQENTRHSSQKSKDDNILNVTATGMYNYHSARRTLNNSHSIPSWLSRCIALFRITSFPRQFRIHRQINFLCKHKPHFTHDIGCTIWTEKAHSEWKSDKWNKTKRTYSGMECMRKWYIIRLGNRA